MLYKLVRVSQLKGQYEMLVTMLHYFLVKVSYTIAKKHVKCHSQNYEADDFTLQRYSQF